MFGPFPGGSCAVQFPQATTGLSQFGGRLRKVWLYLGRFDVIKYSPSDKTILSERRWRWLWGEGGHGLKRISQKKSNKRGTLDAKWNRKFQIMEMKEKERGLKLNSWAWSSLTCIVNTVYSVACVVGAWKVEGARKNGRVSPSHEPILSCACYAGYIFSDVSLPAPGIRHMKPVQKRGLIHLAKLISDIHQLLWKGPCSID